MHGLRTHFDQWVQGLSVITFEQLKDLMVKDQFLDLLPAEVQQFVMDREPKDVVKAAQIADTKPTVNWSSFSPPAALEGQVLGIYSTALPGPQQLLSSRCPAGTGLGYIIYRSARSPAASLLPLPCRDRSWVYNLPLCTVPSSFSPPAALEGQVLGIYSTALHGPQQLLSSRFPGGTGLGYILYRSARSPAASLLPLPWRDRSWVYTLPLCTVPSSFSPPAALQGQVLGIYSTALHGPQQLLSSRCPGGTGLGLYTVPLCTVPSSFSPPAALEGQVLGIYCTALHGPQQLLSSRCPGGTGLGYILYRSARSPAASLLPLPWRDRSWVYTLPLCTVPSSFSPPAALEGQVLGIYSTALPGPQQLLSSRCPGGTGLGYILYCSARSPAASLLPLPWRDRSWVYTLPLCTVPSSFSPPAALEGQVLGIYSTALHGPQQLLSSRCPGGTGLGYILYRSARSPAASLLPLPWRDRSWVYTLPLCPVPSSFSPPAALQGQVLGIYSTALPGPQQLLSSRCPGGTGLGYILYRSARSPAASLLPLPWRDRSWVYTLPLCTVPSSFSPPAALEGQVLGIYSTALPGPQQLLSSRCPGGTGLGYIIYRSARSPAASLLPLPWRDRYWVYTLPLCPVPSSFSPPAALEGQVLGIYCTALHGPQQLLSSRCPGGTGLGYILYRSARSPAASLLPLPWRDRYWVYNLPLCTVPSSFSPPAALEGQVLGIYSTALHGPQQLLSSRCPAGTGLGYILYRSARSPAASLLPLPWRDRSWVYTVLLCTVPSSFSPPAALEGQVLGI
ncbi:uncharacterized protein [Dendrobates tinctorius]|uniref:uncharacterized protein n=1 Tax=Dendrobates tinctorius TaxID=92724 RepID=UPI003CC9D0B5